MVLRKYIIILHFYPNGFELLIFLLLISFSLYSGNRDAISLQRWVLSFVPSSIEHLSGSQFKEKVLNGRFSLPWLVDFYAPWCGHCIHFEPEFRIITQVTINSSI